MDSDRQSIEDRLVLDVETAQAELEQAIREAGPGHAQRREAAKKLERAVTRLCGLILRNVLPEEEQ